MKIFSKIDNFKKLLYNIYVNSYSKFIIVDIGSIKVLPKARKLNVVS